MTLVLFLAQDREDKKEVVVKVLAFILQNFDCNLYLKGAVAFIEFDIETEPEIHITFKCISRRHYGCNSSVHEKISRTSNYRYISTLHHNWVSSNEIYGSLVSCAVKNENMHALSPANWWRIKIVIKGNGIIKNCNFSKMEGAC
ncbi:hypothetical protein Peur_040623 [Populus x canadensis]